MNPVSLQTKDLIQDLNFVSLIEELIIILLGATLYYIGTTAKIKENLCCANLKEADVLMDKSYQYFAEQLQSIRCGAINVGLIDTIRIPHHGQKLPISQIGTSYQKNNQICITPFDSFLLSSIVDVLKQSGFNA